MARSGSHSFGEISYAILKSMKTKALAIIIVFLIVFSGAWWCIKTQSIPDAGTVAKQPTSGPERDTATTTPSVPETKELIYTKDGFNPAVTHLKPGDFVIVKNHSTSTLELVSSKLPAASIAKGKDFKTTAFTEVGYLSVTDKKHPDKIGIILVE